METLRFKNAQSLDKHKPRYVLLAEEILSAIGNGVYKVGSLLPSEPQLCRQYRFSRHTVRDAIRILQKMGIVSSHQGLGTRVESEKVASRYIQAFDAIPDIWEYAKSTKLQVMARRMVEASAVPAEFAETSSSPEWCLVEAIRYGKPNESLAWTQLFFRSDYAEIVDRVGKRRTPLYALIEERFGIKAYAVRQEISGVVISKTMASHLLVKPGSAGVAMMRRYFDLSRNLYEVTKSIYPAERFHYDVEFRLEHGKDVDR